MIIRKLLNWRWFSKDEVRRFGKEGSGDRSKTCFQMSLTTKHNKYYKLYTNNLCKFT